VIQIPFSAEMPTKREKITFTCEKETRDALEAMANEEGRSLSNLVERIVLETLKAKGKK
jgi:uncharacterized protein (DUF1778 family)